LIIAFLYLKQFYRDQSARYLITHLFLTQPQHIAIFRITTFIIRNYRQEFCYFCLFLLYSHSLYRVIINGIFMKIYN